MIHFEQLMVSQVHNIPRILCKSKFLYHVYFISPIFVALNHVNQIHVLLFSFLKFILILSSPAHLFPLSRLSRSDFPATTLNTLILVHMPCAPPPVHDMVTLIVFGDQEV